MPTLKIMGRGHPVKYSSNDTRGVSLHGLMGGAEINEDWHGLEIHPIETPENLEVRFNSGVNRTDCPGMWGPAHVDRRLANKVCQTQNEVAGWKRNKGEPIK